MAVHVRFNSLYISLPSSAKQQRENDQILGCPEIPNLTLRTYHIQFRDSLSSEKQAKRLKRISRDSKVKYKFTI